MEWLDGKRVFIRRDGEDNGFDGVVTQVKGTTTSKSKTI